MGLMDGQVVVIPVAISAYTLGSAKFALREGARLFLGAPRERLAALRGEFAGQKHVHCEELDTTSAVEVVSFMAKASARFRRLDCLLLADEIWKTEDGADTLEEALGKGTRIFLQCLEASLTYLRNELHVITVSPDDYRRVATLMVSLLINSKLKTQSVTIRMTAISSTGTTDFPDGPDPTTSVFGGAARGMRVKARRPLPGSHVRGTAPALL